MHDQCDLFALKASHMLNENSAIVNNNNFISSNSSQICEIYDLIAYINLIKNVFRFVWFPIGTFTNILLIVLTKKFQELHSNPVSLILYLIFCNNILLLGLSFLSLSYADLAELDLVAYSKLACHAFGYLYKVQRAVFSSLMTAILCLISHSIEKIKPASVVIRAKRAIKRRKYENMARKYAKINLILCVCFLLIFSVDFFAVVNWPQSYMFKIRILDEIAYCCIVLIMPLLILIAKVCRIIKKIRARLGILNETNRLRNRKFLTLRFVLMPLVFAFFNLPDFVAKVWYYSKYKLETSDQNLKDEQKLFAETLQVRLAFMASFLISVSFNAFFILVGFTFDRNLRRRIMNILAKVARNIR